MDNYSNNCFEFLKETFKEGGGFMFVIKAMPLSFQTIKKLDKKKAREEIQNRILKFGDSYKKFFSGEITIELNCRFYRRYKSTDVDNIAKFVLDCMKGLAFRDDKQINVLIVRKFKCSPQSNEFIGVNIRRSAHQS